MNVLIHNIHGGTAVDIAEGIEEAVRSGTLAPGAPLPTVRALAQGLGISPTTVAAAYKALRARGLVVTAGRRGSAVSPRPPIYAGPEAPAPAGVRDLGDGNPDPALLPSLAPALAKISADPVLYGGELVEPALAKRALARFRADGIAAQAVSVVSGALDGIERVLAAHLRPGDRVAVEDPAFVGVRDLLAALGLEAVGVPIDDAGLAPAALKRVLSTGVDALIVTPRAGNPFGAALDAARAKALAPVLRRHPDLLLIEDDHAGAVAGAPVFTLVDADHRSRWAVVRSFSKSLGPDLRVAVLAADPLTQARVDGRQLLGIRWVSHVLQRLAFAQWTDRGVMRALDVAGQTYTKRRRALLDALAKLGVRAHGRSGLNVWIPVPDEERVIAGLLERGWALNAGARYRISSAPGVRVCIARLEPEDATALAADIAAVLKALDTRPERVPRSARSSV